MAMMMYRILLADDEKMALLSTMRSLPFAAGNMAVSESVCDPYEALGLLENGFFDAAFLDIRMPGLSGLDIIRKRKDAPFCPEFIVVSGYSDFTYVKQALQLGAFDYCLKPIQSEEAGLLFDRLEGQLYQNRLKNGPLLLEGLANPDTRAKVLEFCGLGQGPLTVIAAEVPSCRSLLALPSPAAELFPVFLEERKALLLGRGEPDISDAAATQLLAIPGCRLAAGGIGEGGRLDKLLARLQTDLLLTSAESPLVQSVAEGPNEAFRQLLEEVRQNYTQDLSLQALGRKYGLSYTYCSELFKSVTGYNFSKYVTRLRMNSAAEQLLSTARPVSDICYASGYHNYHHFAGMFKSFFGLTPTEYRQKGGRAGNEEG